MPSSGPTPSQQKKKRSRAPSKRPVEAQEVCAYYTIIKGGLVGRCAQRHKLTLATTTRFPSEP